jgi:hypothetical protein
LTYWNIGGPIPVPVLPKKAKKPDWTGLLNTMAIEENNTWIVVFGFDKGAAGTVSSHGKKTDHYRDLSRLTMLIFIGVNGLGDFSVGNVTGLRTRTGCGYGYVRVRVRVVKSQPWKNPHPWHGFDGFDGFEGCKNQLLVSLL